MFETVATQRLDLRRADPEDADELFVITSDPATWIHAPGGEDPDREATRRWLERAAARWESDGLSYWTVRRQGEEKLIGVGGVQRQSTGNWNLYYRFSPNVWGSGYATEMATAAIAAAHQVDDTVAVVAWILENNSQSRRVAERLGFINVGFHADPSDGRVRLAYVDRPTSVEELQL